MRIVISEFMSLDGVVQAPGGPDEDADGGFAHGGWSMAFFDPDDVVGAVRQLRAKDGGALQVMGSPNLAGTLISNDLVDEYRLMIEPVLLGGGKRLFPDDGNSRVLELVSTSTSGTGVHICTYRPVAAS